MAKPGKKQDRSILKGASNAGLFPVREEVIHSTQQEELPQAFDARRPEESYREVVDADRRRRFGQFFTPQPIAELMCAWVTARRPKKVLDPACGPGIFVREVLRKTTACEVTAIDIDPVALGAARAAAQRHSSVQYVRADFLTWQPEERFDAVVANPPYLKHHNFHYEYDIFAEIGRRNDIKLSRLTNIYALFILECCRRLHDEGRAAIIVPGEWVNANYGVAIKEFLLSRKLLNVLIYFTHSSLVFEDSLTTASVLLIEKTRKKRTNNEVLTGYVHDPLEIAALTPLTRGETPDHPAVLVQRVPITRLLAAGKWDHLLGHHVEDHPRGFVPLSVLTTTRRGIATGANSFFHVSKQSADERGIQFTNRLACIGRATDVSSIVFRLADFNKLVSGAKRTQLLSFGCELDKCERGYLRNGEALGLPRRYLLAGRTPWYSMEKREPAKIWAAVFGRKSLRFIYNQAGVYNLTTFHCIYPHESDPIFVKALVATLNSRRVQELSKQHRRVYGGGLAKFEPRDLLDILVPDLRVASRETLKKLAGSLGELDVAIRRHSTDEQAVLQRLDDLVDDVAGQAARAAESTPAPPPPDQPLAFPLWEPQTRRDGRVV